MQPSNPACLAKPPPLNSVHAAPNSDLYAATLRLNLDVRDSHKPTIMDPATGLTILGTAVGSAKLLEKFLGPTAEYLGDGLKSWTEKRVNNTKRIFHRATALIGDRIE